MTLRRQAEPYASEKTCPNPNTTTTTPPASHLMNGVCVLSQLGLVPDLGDELHLLPTNKPTPPPHTGSRYKSGRTVLIE